MRHVMPILARSLIAGLALGMTCFSSPALASNLAAELSEAAAKHTEQRIITIFGTGEVALPADSIRTSVGVETRAATLEAARDEAASKAQAVLSALQSLAIPALEIRTVDISLSPITEANLRPEDITEPRIIGYTASSRLSVALRGASPAELQAAGSKILEAAFTAGANDVGGLEFFLRDPGEARRMALSAAVRDAQANADAVAEAANVRVVELQSLSVEHHERYEFTQKAAFESAISGGFPVEPGNIQVTAEVTVRVVFAP
jgi:uncharacterized protein